MSAPRTPSAGRHLTAPNDFADATPPASVPSIFSLWNICLFIIASICVYYGYQYYLAYQKQASSKQGQDEGQAQGQDQDQPPPQQEQEQEQRAVSSTVYPPVSVQSRQPEHNIDRASALDNALNDASARSGTTLPVPAPASMSGKSGWCLTGYDGGVSVCAEVGVNDICMSGDIYPSQAICMNPSLRP